MRFSAFSAAAVLLGLCLSNVYAESLLTARNTNNDLSTSQLDIVKRGIEELSISRRHPREFSPLKTRDGSTTDISIVQSSEDRKRPKNVQQNKVGEATADGMVITVDGCIAVFVWAGGSLFGAHILEGHEKTVMSDLKSLVGSGAVTAVTIKWPTGAKNELAAVRKGLEAFTFAKGVVDEDDVYTWKAGESTSHDFSATAGAAGHVDLM